MQFGLSKTDVTLIKDIIEGYADEPATRILFRLQRIFAHDISTAHYIVFGTLLKEHEFSHDNLHLRITPQN